MTISLKARAKLNLTLEVTGKRSDGFHGVASIMQSLDLADCVTLRPSDSLDLDCDVPDLAGRSNLAWRAAEMLRKESGAREGAAIEIRKRIPIAAGLGGGSADAAAVLVGLNRMWKLGASRRRPASARRPSRLRRPVSDRGRDGDGDGQGRANPQSANRAAAAIRDSRANAGRG